jgi:hypothetical protein
MDCERRRTVVAVDRLGNREDRWKCSHTQACTYGKKVDEDICRSCVLRVPILYKLPPCGAQPPVAAKYKQPVYGLKGELIYEPIDAPEPPIPDGFEREQPWVYKSKWKECPARAYLNTLGKDGVLQLDTRCTILDKPICHADCAACIIDMESLGATESEAAVPTLPGIGTQLHNYWEAIKRWVKAGRPVRSDEEVAELHANFCAKCDWFDKESSRCKGCGCNVKPTGSALLNKIKMATEHCPQQLW